MAIIVSRFKIRRLLLRRIFSGRGCNLNRPIEWYLAILLKMSLVTMYLAELTLLTFSYLNAIPNSHHVVNDRNGFSHAIIKSKQRWRWSFFTISSFHFQRRLNISWRLLHDTAQHKISQKFYVGIFKYFFI